MKIAAKMSEEVIRAWENTIPKSFLFTYKETFDPSTIKLIMSPDSNLCDKHSFHSLSLDSNFLPSLSLIHHSYFGEIFSKPIQVFRLSKEDFT